MNNINVEHGLTPAAGPEENARGSAGFFPNNDFYISSGDADRIMNPAFFPPEINQFLLDEKNALTQLFHQEQYDCIIEVGCHSGHNSVWLSELCGHYIGVDINERCIEVAMQTRRVPGKIDFICSPLESIRPLLLSRSNRQERTIVLFPFNLLGNFTDVKGVVRSFGMAGVDLAMSIFNTCSATTIGRYNYYANCFGRSSIRVYDAEQGVLFKASQNFRSIAYNLEYLNKLIHDTSSYHGIIKPFSSYGELVLLTS